MLAWWSMVPLLNIILGMVIGAVAGYIGTIMLSRKMAIVSGPLGHLALPGAAIALVLGINMSIGAFPGLLVSAALIWWLKKKTSLSEESLTAIVFVAGVGVSMLFLPIDKAEAAFVGDIVHIKSFDAAMFLATALLVLFAVRHYYKDLILAGISNEIAKVEGVDVKRIELIYLLSVALIVALGVNIIGGLLTVAIVVLPSATAKNLSKSLKWYSALGLVSGGVYTLLGILVSSYAGLPVGPSIILVGVCGFLASVIIKNYAPAGI